MEGQPRGHSSAAGHPLHYRNLYSSYPFFILTTKTCSDPLLQCLGSAAPSPVCYVSVSLIVSLDTLTPSSLQRATSWYNTPHPPSRSVPSPAASRAL